MLVPLLFGVPPRRNRAASGAAFGCNGGDDDDDGDDVPFCPFRQGDLQTADAAGEKGAEEECAHQSSNSSVMPCHAMDPDLACSRSSHRRSVSTELDLG